MELNWWSWKIIVRVVRSLLQLSKQGQNKMQTGYVRSAQNKDDFDN